MMTLLFIRSIMTNGMTCWKIKFFQITFSDYFGWLPWLRMGVLPSLGIFANPKALSRDLGFSVKIIRDLGISRFLPSIFNKRFYVQIWTIFPLRCSFVFKGAMVIFQNFIEMALVSVRSVPNCCFLKLPLPTWVPLPLFWTLVLELTPYPLN